jgi:hypothetical protein
MSDLTSQNFYKILGVAQTAEEREIKKAYFSLMFLLLTGIAICFQRSAFGAPLYRSCHVTLIFVFNADRNSFVITVI